MAIRYASCSCGQLRMGCRGEPFLVSVCHCLACQQRTGSTFGVQARFQRDQVQQAAGRSTIYVRISDSGTAVTYHFCPDCGSTVYWVVNGVPDMVAVAVGAFADPDFPAPAVSVFEASRHDWVGVGGDGLQHND